MLCTKNSSGEMKMCPEWVFSLFSGIPAKWQALNLNCKAECLLPFHSYHPACTKVVCVDTSFLFFFNCWLPPVIFFLSFLFLFKNLFIYFWLCWVFLSVRGLSLVAASRGHSSSRCAGLSLSRPLLLWSIGSRGAGSVVVAHGPSCSAACGILPDQGSNPRPLH